MIAEIQKLLQKLPETASAVINISRNGSATLMMTYYTGKRARPEEYGLQEGVSDDTIIQSATSLTRCLSLDLERRLRDVTRPH